MRSFFAAIVTVIVLASFYSGGNLKGTWEYCGGITNGKLEAPPTDYKLQRKYNGKTFEAFLLEPNLKPEKYQSGRYQLVGDTCLETEDFNNQSDVLTGKTLRYHYAIIKDTLKLHGVLPNGAQVTEYWKKIK